ncbi:MAG: GDYXXLXY domain-containing protein [Caldilineaceae bacterium]
MRRQIGLWLVVLVVLGFVNYAVVQKELLIRNGTLLLLEIGPRDPRSLIQGDYMAIRYRMPAQIRLDELPHSGQLVVQRSANGAGEVLGVYDGQTPLAADELLVNFYQRAGDIEIGATSFFFQEGQAETYQAARYGELRVAASGEAILVGLADQNFKTLGAAYVDVNP